MIRGALHGSLGRVVRQGVCGGALLTDRRRGFRTAAVRWTAGETTAWPLTQLNEDEELMRESVVKPRVQEMDEREEFDPTVVQDMFSQGLMGIEVPVEHGGAGASFMSAIVAIEELARVDPSVSVMCDVQNTLVNTAFRTYASEALQKTYLPRLATDTVGSFCLSEPGSGSDAFALKMRAEKVTDGYKLTGSKMWITNASDSKIFLVFATLDPSLGRKGISCFAVEKDWGIEIMKKEKKVGKTAVALLLAYLQLGIRASSTCLINLDGVFVPKENLVGEEGKGYKYAIELLNEGRVGIAAQMIGLAQGAFDLAVSYCINDRQQFGSYVADFQGMQFQIAEIATEIEAGRLLLYNAARLKEAGKPFIAEAAMAKLFASQIAQKASGAAIEWAGGVGFTREVGIEKFWRDSKIGAIYEGTSNIQKQTIYRQLKSTYRK